MKKFFVYSLSSALLAGSILSGAGAVSAATQEEFPAENITVNQSVSLGELISTGKIKNATLKNRIYSVTYEKDQQEYKVEYNGNTGLVTINGAIQEGFTFEYNPQLALNSQKSVESTNTVSINAAAAKSGYSYVGTLKGHTDTAKNAYSLAVQLSLLIPGTGWGINAVKVLLLYTDYDLNEKIPSKYYKYDLYQKGFMTNNWYQYSVTTLYEDKNYKIKSGESWTSNPQKIDLPNS
ncbi:MULTISPECIES: hypothetical protein [Aneurinibacillus]|uniref:Uncharacterized protein n=1 Tax=Aneurinibacillus thermoaerophilus TaxID=143495 RepID=A0ABX8YBU6_ANETH|nr:MULTISPECIES: hypothetical protein [Aneurinibacillus]AMA71776.1 hypothetical protein ACH33_02250 [Aneurinibacillus sp. XH2]MED0738761.1 hypothetical protein [Aneurinibacillus thermoaerophilus]QYY42463.1 hypothetical protein K3F53_16710 [Aneurinibacillus thermoaerophilus]